MASLMEDLLNTLEQENAEYEQLLALSLKKTPVIVNANLEELQQITDEEQLIVSRINKLDKVRNECMTQIAGVIHKDVNELTLAMVVDIFKKRPEEHKKLAAVFDKLKDTIAQMKRANEQNRQLLQSSLELVQFDMNMLQAMKTAPETANYSKNAYSTGAVMGTGTGRFDAKQ